MSTGAAAEFNRIARVALKLESDLLEQAEALGDEPWQAAQRKQVALFAERLLCTHPDIEYKELRVHGTKKHAYKCTACKSYKLTKTPL